MFFLCDLGILKDDKFSCFSVLGLQRVFYGLCFGSDKQLFLLNTFRTNNFYYDLEILLVNYGLSRDIIH